MHAPARALLVVPQQLARHPRCADLALMLDGANRKPERPSFAGLRAADDIRTRWHIAAHLAGER
jgi:hypothetical protein